MIVETYFVYFICFFLIYNYYILGILYSWIAFVDIIWAWTHVIEWKCMQIMMMMSFSWLGIVCMWCRRYTRWSIAVVCWNFKYCCEMRSLHYSFLDVARTKCFIFLKRQWVNPFLSKIDEHHHTHSEIVHLNTKDLNYVTSSSSSSHFAYSSQH